jgi:hypothetical protein
MRPEVTASSMLSTVAFNISDRPKKERKLKGCRCGSVVECLPSIPEALGFISSTGKTKQIRTPKHTENINILRRSSIFKYL